MHTTMEFLYFFVFYNTTFFRYARVGVGWLGWGKSGNLIGMDMDKGKGRIGAICGGELWEAYPIDYCYYLLLWLET